MTKSVSVEGVDITGMSRTRPEPPFLKNIPGRKI